ncbi:glycosyltransferase family 1 protein [Parablautia intestinalis]|uniref:Glycosyltransferase family 1 protein n=1 Tax=Parablautia intestinalis TaxID=2320100 RepID=A0A3A9AQN8_9FIRM|nr:glycosyltransferase [Parablautia intestinalis]RKI88655.1 glycosyltransferase family 1 protein [Parablautia intestinalis]
MEKRIEIMDYQDDFYKIMSESERKLVLYGMGAVAENVYLHFTNIFCVCDRKARNGELFHGIPVIAPDDLEKMDEKLAILICVKKEDYRTQIVDMLLSMNIDAFVFDFYNNSSFNTFRQQKRKIIKNACISKVRLVCSDNGWILCKFAEKMKEELLKSGIQAEIGKGVDITADINHHIAFHLYEPLLDCNDTLMITHVDTINKVNLIKHQLQVAKMGICMSRDMMSQLVQMGVPREKICYINPAQDGVIKPRKYVLGITHRVYDDHRKRSGALLDICNGINPDYFEFKIMGAGWEQIVEEVCKKGFLVTYYPEFDYDTYVQLIPSLDYYLYWGFDEGSMGYLDALAAGIGTIVTPQGYHLDTRNGLTYPCNTIADFIDVLSKLEMERYKTVSAVTNWTWENYTKKHIEVWKYIIGQEEGIYDNQHKYEDGINSVYRI